MSQLNWRRQAILAATLFVLGTITYWLVYKHQPDQEAAKEQSKKLFRLKDVAIQSVRLSDSKKTIELNCSDLGAKLCKPGDNSKWELSEPIKIKADDSNANSLISSLNNLTTSDTIDLKDETPEKRQALLKEYGVDAESRKSSSFRKVFVQTPKGTTAVYIGQSHPIGDSFFAVEEKVAAGHQPTGSADENTVYLVPTYFKSNFEHDLTYWRDKKLFSLNASQIVSFSLNDSKSKLSGERRSGEWTIKSGKEELAGDIENIDNLLTSATYLNAKDFVADSQSSPKARAALRGSRKVLTLTIQKDQGTEKTLPAPVTLTLFEKKLPKKKGMSTNPTKLYATLTGSDPVYELEPYSKDRLDKSVKDLRLMKLLTSMERFTIKRIEFKGKSIGSNPLLLTQVGDKWQISGEKTAVDGEKVQTLLDKLSGNRIKDFLQGRAIPKGEQEGIQLTLGDDKSEKKRDLVFWKNGDKLYGRDLLSKRPEAFLVDTAIREGLPWDRGFFKKAETADSAKKK